jgi:DNA-directed RNA polymerase sigma subunit (sigma70/sigma32)
MKLKASPPEIQISFHRDARDDAGPSAPEETLCVDGLQPRVQQRLDLERAIAHCFTNRDAMIVRLRFGLHDGDSWTLLEIGRRLGLSRERIRQIETDALYRLRRYFGVKVAA